LRRRHGYQESEREKKASQCVAVYTTAWRERKGDKPMQKDKSGGCKTNWNKVRVAIIDFRGEAQNKNIFSVHPISVRDHYVVVVVVVVSCWVQ
jgi:hypothetical protein